MTILAATAPAQGAVRYTLRIAMDSAEVKAAQRLRHQVFAGELGARLRSPEPGLDVDEFDEVCDHLVVVAEDGTEVVGTYRMLPPGRSARRYSDTEFDLSALAPIADELVEAGRSCVHPGHRDGTVINLMWAGIARYMHLSGYRWLAGCASVGLSDGGIRAAGVWDLVRRKHLAPPEYRVLPHRPWQPVEPLGGRAGVPPLLRGYLRLGAWVCGAPAHDPDFDCADLYVLLGLDRVDPRYLRHFLGTGAP
jgi:putative hemolysin